MGRSGVHGKILHPGLYHRKIPRDLKHTQGPSHWQFLSLPQKARKIPSPGAYVGSLCFFSILLCGPYQHLCLSASPLSVSFSLFLSLSFSLSLSLIVLNFLGRFSFFYLWPCFLPSCRKAIKLARAAAGSRQSLCSEG